MTINAGKKSIHCHVTPAAHTWWHDTAAEHRVSVSALLEAVAEHDVAFHHTIVRRAAEIDTARRRRTFRTGVAR